MKAPNDFRNLLLQEKDLNRQMMTDDQAFRNEIDQNEREKEVKKKQRPKLLEEKRKYEVIIPLFH